MDTVNLFDHLFLEDYEQFAKIMFLSAKKQKENHEIELPMQSEQGKFNFYDLKVHNLFWQFYLHIKYILAYPQYRQVTFLYGR